VSDTATPTDAAELVRTAARASSNVPRTTPDERAGHILAALAGVRFDSVRDIAVCSGDRLVGLLRIEDLLAADPQARASALMDPDPPVLRPGGDREAAAWDAARHRESSLAVVDEHGRLLGIVPPHQLVAMLLAEHDEDVARLAGMLGTADPARAVSQEPVRQRLAHRLPWLLLGLAGALAAAGVVGAFEQQLAAHVAVAFFVPSIVYMADAVGTQTEAIVIRGLSVGVPIRAILARELVTGIIVGAVLALLFVPIGLAGWGEPWLITAVAVALFSACTTATAVAMALPALLVRLGSDPAFGSGPLATVVQDLLSLVIYFAVVTVLLP
jgi:magnesium transporter